MEFEISEDTDLYIPASNDEFIDYMAKQGRPWATKYGFPLPAMIACACVESGFGTSTIYRLTGCPFNLQKPAGWKYPQCSTRLIPTINKAGEQAKPSPFCLAKDLADAARLWCEWINYWPNPKARNAVIGFSQDAVLFASQLHLVGFAESKKANTKKFGDLIAGKDLMRFM